MPARMAALRAASRRTSTLGQYILFALTEADGAGEGDAWTSASTAH